MSELVLLDKPAHGSPEWHAARHRDDQGRARLTASVAAAIMGEHEFLSSADLALQQLRDQPPDDEMTDAMERGHALEGALLDHWSRKTGIVVIRPESMFVRGRWLANPDGLTYESWSDDPVEAKSTKHRFRPELFGVKPFAYWRWQGVAQRWCVAGEPGAVQWSILDGDLCLHLYEQDVTQDDIDRLLEAGEEWLSYIDLGMMPPTVEMNARQVATLNEGRSGRVDLPTDALLWVRRLTQARALKRQGEADETEAKDWLARHLGAADVGLVDGVEVVTNKEQAGRLGFDTVGLKREYPDLYDKFEKSGKPFRSMLTKGETGD